MYLLYLQVCEYLSSVCVEWDEVLECICGCFVTQI